MFDPIIFLPKLNIVSVSIVPIRLPFKRDIIISSLPIFRNLCYPLYKVPQIEEDVKHLLHLLGMDIFMINGVLGKRFLFFPSKDEAEQINRCEWLERNIFVVYYSHD